MVVVAAGVIVQSVVHKRGYGASGGEEGGGEEGEPEDEIAGYVGAWVGPAFADEEDEEVGEAPEEGEGALEIVSFWMGVPGFGGEIGEGKWGLG